MNKSYKRKIVFFFKNKGLRFDRSFSGGFYKQLSWLVAIMIVVYLLLIGLSYIKSLYSPSGEAHNRWYNVMFLLIDPGEGSESMTPLFAVIVAMFGLVVFGGMLISVMSNLLERRVERYTNGETDYAVHNHVVVIGFNKGIPSLINKIHDKYPDSFILLMSNRRSEFVRSWLHSYLENNVEENVIVLKGVLTAKDDIDRLSLKNNVQEIYVLGEEDDDCHDANNLRCVELISDAIDNENARIKCHVQIDSNSAYTVLQHADFGEKFKTRIPDGNNEVSAVKLVFLPFNFNEIWAQKIIATSNDTGYDSLDADGITCDSSKHVHLILIGTNELAASIAVNAAHILHFPNFKEGDFSTYSHITFIDSDIHDFANKFRLQYRNLFNLCRWREIDIADCHIDDYEWSDPFAMEDSEYKHLGNANFLDIQWEFISGGIFDKRVQEYLSICATRENEITTIVLCSKDSELNASLCLALPYEICNKSNQILVRQNESETTIKLISGLPYRDKVKAFGMTNECYGENLVSDTYGMIMNGMYNEESIPDQETIQKKWDNCSILNKWSSIYCANMLYVKLRSLGLVVNENLTEEMIVAAFNNPKLNLKMQYQEHNRWITEKLLLGFAPLTYEAKTINKNNQTDEYKALKKRGICHIDICSNEILDIIDPGTRKYDNDLNSKLWLLLCEHKGIKTN